MILKYLKITPFLILFITSAFSEELKINDLNEYEPSYTNRFSFIFGLNPSLTRSQDLTSYQFSYAKNTSENFWIDFSAQMTGAKFRDIGENNSISTTVSDDQIYDASETITSVGVGFGYKTTYSPKLLPLNIYETISTNIIYASMKEDAGGKTFKGPGIKAKLSILKPFGPYLHAGINLDYNLLSLKRPEVEDEPGKERNLTLSWVSIGLDISFYL